MAGTNTFDYASSWEKIIRIWSAKASNPYGQYSLYNRDYEDIYQELWVKVLETAKELAGTDSDLTLEDNQNKVTKVCHDAIISIKRYDQVRNKNYTVDMSDSGTNDESDDGYNPYNTLSYMGFNIGTPDYDDIADWHKFVEQFPEDSKERKYLDFWATESGIEPTTKNIPKKTYKNDGWTRSGIAQLLGYADSSSSGYRVFEEKMMKLIADYWKNRE